MRQSSIGPRVLLLTSVTLTLSGCDSIAKKATEKAIETATGNEVSFDGQKVRIKTEDGKTAEIDGRGETVTVKTEAGETVYAEKDGKVTVSGPEGRVEVSGSEGGALPKDFPLPIPPDTSVVRTAQMDSEGGGVMRNASLQSSSSPKALADFYAKHLESEGFTVKRTETQAGPMSMALVAAEKGKVQVGAQIIAGAGGEAGSMVNLSWVEKR